jgi:serine/threonine-protein phosphatase 2B regulatory subunit
MTVLIDVGSRTNLANSVFLYLSLSLSLSLRGSLQSWILLLVTMGNTSSMLTQYDIEEVQQHCKNACSSLLLLLSLSFSISLFVTNFVLRSVWLVTQQEIVSLYQRFCQLDRNNCGFIPSDEFLSIPEFAVNPLSQSMLRLLDGFNFKEFIAFLSAFSPRATLQDKIECMYYY